ncbi:hypothetical protein [Acetivibrio mesophilus]|uniref:Uncharacterized protein n=1 Tax=Acetivibrio mesophilus TaxID=2487273 RepID=A0A4V1K1R5_9FIRM|nr:hypothetical protein [Acetivibrio mesophilus]RXE57709.1 hypothetical protein EFD62_16125 [Acetivibrio mesophilus]
MDIANNVKWDYEKLGTIQFKVDDKGNPVIDIEKTRDIILMGVDVLVCCKLLSDAERRYFAELFTKMEIAIDEELPGRSSLQFNFNRLTGKIVDATLCISGPSMYIDTNEMIKSILENLCFLIVMYKHPEEHLKEMELFGPNVPFGRHGALWVQYANALLPDEYIMKCKYSYAACSYILNNKTAEQAEVFEDALGKGWESDLADEYAEELLENEMTAEEYPIADFLQDRYDEYTDQFDEDNDDEIIDEDDIDETIKESSINTLEKYCSLMEEKYENEIENIGNRLVIMSSYKKGPALYEIIQKLSNPELRYYLFIRYWTGIDAGHELFTPKKLHEWLIQSNVRLDFSDLKMNSDGYVTVYRGENEYSLPWDKGALSWTTSKPIAEKFARGIRLRTQDAPKPRIVVGKVNRDDILARFDGRKEFELLCQNVVFLAEEKLA